MVPPTQHEVHQKWHEARHEESWINRGEVPIQIAENRRRFLLKAHFLDRGRRGRLGFSSAPGCNRRGHGRRLRLTKPLRDEGLHGLGFEVLRLSGYVVDKSGDALAVSGEIVDQA